MQQLYNRSLKGYVVVVPVQFTGTIRLMNHHDVDDVAVQAPQAALHHLSQLPFILRIETGPVRGGAQFGRNDTGFPDFVQRPPQRLFAIPVIGGCVGKVHTQFKSPGDDRQGAFEAFFPARNKGSAQGQFADFQTGYYLAREPHNVLIAERDGQPGGYLMLCADGKAYARFLARQLPGLALRVLWKMAAGRLSRATRRYIRWLIVRGWREVPRRPAGACHFHVNALPAARGAGMGIRLITEMESLAATRGIHKLYGQMTVQPGRRGAALFRHWGWQLTDTKPVSKFREHYGRDCLLATIEKEL